MPPQPSPKPAPRPRTHLFTGSFVHGANRDRAGDLLLAKRPLPRPISALKVGDLQGLLASGHGEKIGADARGLSAIIVVSGTFDDECLDDHR
jgi:hypothetical protein